MIKLVHVYPRFKKKVVLVVCDRYGNLGMFAPPFSCITVTILYIVRYRKLKTSSCCREILCYQFLL